MSGLKSVPKSRVRPWAWFPMLMLAALSSIVRAVCAADAPALELLEFVAEWQGADGEPLDPTMFDDDALPVAGAAPTSEQHGDE